MRYAIWNNKGGVGKSFLTFVFASEYALAHPEKMVCVVDMCPQANVSEILLGGNGRGAEVLAGLLEPGNRQSIGGYFESRLSQPHRITGLEGNFPITVSRHNENIPRNLVLVAGDPVLEVQAEAINQIANQSLPQGTWKNVHSWLADLCAALEVKWESPTIFIDCNPSFAAYTELAVVAANKLIIPCSADGSSARAIDNICQLVYGHGVPEQYRHAMFSSRLRREGLNPPGIKMVLLNRSTQYNEAASKAFGEMFREIERRTNWLLEEHPMARGGDEGGYFHDIPDTHSVAIVASHHGIPISRIKVGKYQVFYQRTMVNGGPLERYKSAIDSVVPLL